VGPTSSSCSEQMNVRSSTRATSAGSERAQWLLGRLASLSRVNVPASTSSWAKRSYSSADPSHQWMRSGWHRAATSSTQSRSLLFVVVAPLLTAVFPSTAVSPSVLLSRFPPSSRFDRWRPCGRTHVDLGAQSEARGPVLAVEIEDHPLPLAQHAEDGPRKSVGRQVVLAAVGVADQHAFTRARVVRLDHSLHKRGPPLPTLGAWTLPEWPSDHRVCPDRAASRTIRG